MRSSTNRSPGCSPNGFLPSHRPICRRRRIRAARSFATMTDFAVREGKISYEEAGRLLQFYEDGLQGYTYLEDPKER